MSSTKSGKKERLWDRDPWPEYTSSNPLELAMSEFRDDQYYSVDRSFASRPVPLPKPPIAQSPAPSKEHFEMNPGCRGACAVRVQAQQALQAQAGGRKEMMSTDPRFVPETSLIYYSIGSDVNEITRTYGTVAQKAQYPEYTDMIKYGVTGIPKPDVKPQRKETPKISKDFMPPPTKVTYEHMQTMPDRLLRASPDMDAPDRYLSSVDSLASREHMKNPMDIYISKEPMALRPGLTERMALRPGLTESMALRPGLTESMALRPGLTENFDIRGDYVRQWPWAHK
jgi:hypothetical protein